MSLAQLKEEAVCCLPRRASIKNVLNVRFVDGNLALFMLEDPENLGQVVLSPFDWVYVDGIPSETVTQCHLQENHGKACVIFRDYSEEVLFLDFTADKNSCLIPLSSLINTEATVKIVTLDTVGRWRLKYQK